VVTGESKRLVYTYRTRRLLREKEEEKRKGKRKGKRGFKREQGG